MNKVILMGTVADLKTAQTKDGKPIVNLRLKTVRKFGDKTFTDSHRVSCFGTAAESTTGCLVGDALFIEGRISNRSYEKDGQKQWVTEITAESATPISSVVEANEPQQDAPY